MMQVSIVQKPVHGPTNQGTGFYMKETSGITVLNIAEDKSI